MGKPLRDFNMDRMEFELIFKNRMLTKGEIKNIW